MNLTSLKSRSRALLASSIIGALTLFSVSCGSGGTNLSIPGVTGPTVTLTETGIRVDAVFENLQLQGGLRYNIPKYDNSFIEISPSAVGTGTLMAISVSAKDLVNGQLQLLDPQKLPGGRDLPGVVGGKLPAVAFSIQSLKNMSFYIGPKFYGIFFPLNLDIGTNNIISATYSVGNAKAGVLSMIGADASGKNSGFLLLLDLNSTVKRKLRKMARR